MERGVPHCNAWAIASGDGVVLIDCGMHAPDGPKHLQDAMSQCGLDISQVRRLVCTHAHADHCGGASEVVRLSGCEFWVHPAYRDLPEWQALGRTPEIPEAIAARHGVPQHVSEAWRNFHASDRRAFGQPVAPTNELRDGVEIATDLGSWIVRETPGHAPSHVCLHQPERALMFTGDHVMGKVSVFFEFSGSRDPVGEFLDSLDIVDQLDPRLGLSGHGRTFLDVGAYVGANRRLIQDRLTAALTAVGRGAPPTAFEVMVGLHGPPPDPISVFWWMNTTLGYLRRLEVAEKIEALTTEVVRWVRL